MLKKNQTMYLSVISRLALSELTSLYERSKEYPSLCSAIEAEIDLRIAPRGEAGRSMQKRSLEPAELNAVGVG